MSEETTVGAVFNIYLDSTVVGSFLAGVSISF